MAFRGLALSRAPAARARLAALAEGRARPPRDFDDAAGGAASARRLMAELEGVSGATPASTGNPRVADTQPSTHESGITYANHPDVTSPMDDARLDAVLGLASLRAGRADFGADVSCCVLVTRSGSVLTFGAVGDGLDVIDDDDELDAVLDDATARTKVVRTINYCGGPGMNIIGCAETPGNSMTVVRRTNLGSEAVLWMHEYGHNTGLNHNGNSRYLMAGTDNGANDGLSQGECNAFHAPHPAAGIIPTAVGACADTDLDAVHDLIDNCPTIANFEQADADADGVGDLCETVCGDGVPDGPEECDDGNVDPDDGCTDSCTICGNGVVTAPEECDDGNLLGGDSCSASCLLTCPSAPVGGCIVPAQTQRATLLLRKKALSSGDQLVWKWMRGPGTPKADFGAPTATTGYALYVYDGAGLVLDANAPAGGVCNGRPCWSERSTSFKYSDKELTPDGLQQVVLKEGLLVGKGQHHREGERRPAADAESRRAGGADQGPAPAQRHEGVLGGRLQRAFHEAGFDPTEGPRRLTRDPRRRSAPTIDSDSHRPLSNAPMKRVAMVLRSLLVLGGFFLGMDAWAEDAKPSKPTVAKPGPVEPARAKTVTPSEQVREMVSVPGGPFFMGCSESVDTECIGYEKPGRTVEVGAFSIDTTEVTVAAYARCRSAEQCSSSGLNLPFFDGQDQPDFAEFCNWQKPGRENHPINCLNWDQAVAFCTWAGKRLPTEAEWEKAARGTDGRKYPWGSVGYGSARKVANIADETAKGRYPQWTIAAGYDDGFVGTTVVGSFPAGASPSGALDMIGNVFEWTADSFEGGRAVRGGSWDVGPPGARASSRSWVGGENRNANVGFRCAR